jgi:hypothetical protein
MPRALRMRKVPDAVGQVQPKKVARVELPPIPPADAKKCLSEASEHPASSAAAFSYPW